eukprot:353436-Chlamydomonas_euryale.AAC.11
MSSLPFTAPPLLLCLRLGMPRPILHAACHPTGLIAQSQPRQQEQCRCSTSDSSVQSDLDCHACWSEMGSYFW